MIGMGQFGKVYLARYQRTSWVAVKFLDVGIVNNHENVAKNLLKERFVCHFLDAHNIPHLTRYVGLVDSFNSGGEGNLGQRGLVFELCANISEVEEEALRCVEGYGTRCHFFTDGLPDWSHRVSSSLRTAVVCVEHPKFATNQMVGMLRKTAVALASVHGLGFLHRDIADGNVLCDSHGNVRLADFGLAKYVGRGASNNQDAPINYYKREDGLTKGNLYALAWWAPECIGGEESDCIFSTASDVFSFGVLMWQCFSGRDPFDEVWTMPDRSTDPGDPESLLREKIMSGERPNTKRLKRSTPDQVRNLIEQCWETDPDKRPTIEHIINTLETIENNIDPLSCQPSCVRRSPKARWFDVKKMYLEYQISDLEKLAKASPRPGSPSYMWWLESMQGYNHSECPSMDPLTTGYSLSSSPLDRPFDVFLAHTGKQKRIEASTLKSYLEDGRLRCFLDQDNLHNSGGPPTCAMEAALETSRHVVVIVSKALLGRREPRAELDYAFRRMEWLRANNYWTSLWVILYDITVAEYNSALRHGNDPASAEYAPLPDLGGACVVMEWSSNNFGRGASWGFASKLVSLMKTKTGQSLDGGTCWSGSTFSRKQDFHARVICTRAERDRNVYRTHNALSGRSH